MRRIAFVTYQALPTLSASDQLVLPYLHQSDVATVAVAWDDPSIGWATFDAVILRSCWDYHLRPTAFRTWLMQLESQGVRVWNAVPVVRWNMDKQYLHDLHQTGVAIPPSRWFDHEAVVDLHAILGTEGWSRVVIKPRISATAHHTWVATARTLQADQRTLNQLLQQGGVLIQPFIDEIVTQGEWSLIYFDKHYSHAVVKRPKNGDFRVQDDFGGTVDVGQPVPALLDQAQAIMDILPDRVLYTRLDAVVRDGQLMVMEVELIEPFLFLDRAADAAQHFATAIQRYIAMDE
jgi:hypothetical protein